MCLKSPRPIFGVETVLRQQNFEKKVLKRGLIMSLDETRPGHKNGLKKAQKLYFNESVRVRMETLSGQGLVFSRLALDPFWGLAKKCPC